MSEKASTKIARHYRKLKQMRLPNNPIKTYFEHPQTKEKTKNSVAIPAHLLEELLKEKRI